MHICRVENDSCQFVLSCQDNLSQVFIFIISKVFVNEKEFYLE